MWELDHKEDWALKNWCFQILVLEKTLESPLDCKEIQPVNPKENQPWIFIGRTDAEAKALILWPPDVKSQLIGKDPDARKGWRQAEKGATENEMVVWHHWLYGRKFEQLQEIVKIREAWRAVVHGVTKRRTQLSNWTTATNNSVVNPTVNYCVSIKIQEEIWVFLFFGCAQRLLGILVSQSGIEPMPLAVEVQNPNHWSAREVSRRDFKNKKRKMVYVYHFWCFV